MGECRSYGAGYGSELPGLNAPNECQGPNVPHHLSSSPNAKGLFLSRFSSRYSPKQMVYCIPDFRHCFLPPSLRTFTMMSDPHSHGTQGNALTLGFLTVLGLFLFVSKLAVCDEIIISDTELIQYPITAMVYNIYFHPLANFPGPIFWRVSRIPYMISLLRGNLVKDQLEIHRKYGEVVRLAPNEISFTKEEAWQDIYAKRVGHQNPTKDPVWYKGRQIRLQHSMTRLTFP